jgi:hypothetical protein
MSCQRTYAEGESSQKGNSKYGIVSVTRIYALIPRVSSPRENKADYLVCFYSPLEHITIMLMRLTREVCEGILVKSGLGVVCLLVHFP